jgi:hypothetical protein
MTHTTQRPAAGEYAPFYAGYLSLVPEGDVLALLREQEESFRRLPAIVPPDRENFGYAPGKWTIREVVGHLGDAERVFGHRAFCISRGEQASLPGFDENSYVARSGSNERTLAELAGELALLREVNRRLLTSLDAARWDLVGIANDSPVSVRGLAWILAGHAAHHFGILRERYRIAA